MNSKLVSFIFILSIFMFACASDSSNADNIEKSKEVKALKIEMDEIIVLKDSLDRVKNRISSSTEKADALTTIKIREFETFAAAITGDYKFYQESKSRLEQGLISKEEFEENASQIAESMRANLEKIKIINKAYFDPNPLD